MTVAVRSPAAMVTAATSVPSGIVPKGWAVMAGVSGQFVSCGEARAFRRTPGDVRPGRPRRTPPDGLVVGTGFRILAQHAVDGMEHLAHARLGDRALDHDDHFRLVGRRTDEAPGAVLVDDADAVDGDEIDDLLAGDRLAARLHRLET